MSSASEHWPTPSEILDLVRQVNDIGLDPCSNSKSIVNAKKEFFFPRHDGLVESWAGHDGLVYVNPPYGRKIKKWAEKASGESTLGTEIIMLVPARTDTKWMHDFIFNSASAVCFWKGRIKFLGAQSSAPFPSAIVYWGSNVERFEEVFSTKGLVVRV